MNIVTLFALCCFLAAGCSPDNHRAAEEPPRQIVIAVSPFLKNRTEVVVAMTAWITHQAKSEVHIFDGWDGTEITEEFSVPEVKYFSEGAVAQHIGAPLQKLIAWNQRLPVETKFTGTGALALTKVLERITQNCPAPDRLILIGSPIQRIPSDPDHDFSLPRLRYPSLGHLKATNSPFSSVGREGSFAGTRVYYLFPNEAPSDFPGSYESHLLNFFGAFFASRGAALISFTPDFDAGLRMANSGRSNPLNQFALTGDLGPVVMIEEGSAPSRSEQVLAKVSKEKDLRTNSSPADSSVAAGPKMTNTASTVPDLTTTPPPQNAIIPRLSQPITPIVPPPLVVNAQPVENQTNSVRRNPPPAAPAIPETKPGVTIAIRYKSDNAAADLYIRPFSGADEISFQKPQTVLGAYNYQFDFATGEHVKWVWLPGGCDPTKGDVWLNFSAGAGHISGKVIWLTPAGQTETPFSFAAFEGGDSDYKREMSRRKSLRWFRVDLLQFVAGRPTSLVSPTPPISFGKPLNNLNR